MRKVRSLQHLSGGAGISDYPTHSRKILAVVDQQGQRSQMPEHVMLADSKHVAGRPAAQHSESPHRERVRLKHTYEQIELPITEDHNSTGHHADIHPPDLVASVKRSNRWSPGLSKHLKEKQEQSRAKRAGTDKTVDRTLNTGAASTFSVGRRNSTPARLKKENSTNGLMKRISAPPHRFQQQPRNEDTVSLQHWGQAGALDTVSLQESELEWSSQTTATVSSMHVMSTSLILQ